MTEEWRPVVGWDGFYEVSNLGAVRSIPRLVRRRDGGLQTFGGCVLSMPLNTNGYPCVRLRDESHGRSGMPRVHRLVALAFLGPQPNGKEVNHVDGNKRNAAVTNLEWVTSRENRQHAWKMGLRDHSDLPIKYGEEHVNAKLTVAIVTEARRRQAAGEKIRALARQFGVDAATMRRAIKGVTWKLPAPPGEAALRRAGEKP